MKEYVACLVVERRPDVADHSCGRVLGPGSRLSLLASLQKVNVDGDAAGSDRVLTGTGSALAWQSLNNAGRVMGK